MTFIFTKPTEVKSPVVINVPHAGTEIPDWCRASFAATDPFILKRDSDLYVDELYANAKNFGIPLLATTISRYVIDLNRDPTARDASFALGGPVTENPMHLGLIAHKTMIGNELLKVPLPANELARRVELYHQPFHDELMRLMIAAKNKFGFALSLEGHSMPSEGSRGHIDNGQKRAEIVLGTCDGKSIDPKLVKIIREHFESHGLSVAENSPYKGAYVTQTYGKPVLGLHSILVEINRKLYMDEATHAKKPAEFARLKIVLDGLMGKLALVGI